MGGSGVLFDSLLDQTADSWVSDSEALEALGFWETLSPVDSSPEMGLATGDIASNSSNIVEYNEGETPDAEFLSKLNYENRKV